VQGMEIASMFMQQIFFVGNIARPVQMSRRQ